MAGFIVEFRDEMDKQTLVEKAQNAKEVVCDLWEEMAKHMPELHQVQERNNQYRYGMTGGMGGAMMGNPNGFNGHLGYRNYGGYGMTNPGYRAYPMGAPTMGGYRDGYGPTMGYGGQYRENPAYTGPGDARGI